MFQRAPTVTNGMSAEKNVCFPPLSRHKLLSFLLHIGRRSLVVSQMGNLIIVIVTSLLHRRSVLDREKNNCQIHIARDGGNGNDKNDV